MQHNMYGDNFTKNTIGQFCFSVSPYYGKIVMVSTHNKMNEVDMEPIYGYYEKYSLVPMGGGGPLDQFGACK
jgi:hypothetical protein